MTDYVQTMHENGSEGREPADLIGLLAKPVIQTIVATSYTLDAGHHGKILDFISGSAVTVTVPEGLPSDFICGISAGGAGQVTLAAAGDVAIHEPDSQLATAAQFVLLTLMAFSADVFRLYGRTA